MATPVFEAGFFFIILALAFIFTFVSFRFLGKANLGLRLLSIALFSVLTIFISAGYQVSFTNTSNQITHNVVTNETWIENDTNNNVIIPGGTTSFWLAYVFAGLAFMNIFFITRDIVFV